MPELRDNIQWLKMRSDIYLRDKGICWICNSFVDLNDYELGHLIDRRNGGQDAYDNLAVMHKFCNRSKPLHNTLEEAMKWKLTVLAITRPHANIDYPHANIDYPEVTYPKKERQPMSQQTTFTLQQETIYQQQIKKIIPRTLTWKRGFIRGGVVWDVLPPPYHQEDKFTLRRLPPGATDNKYLTIRETIQVINGILSENVSINMGSFNMHISPNGNKLNVTFTTGINTNVGTRSQTIGFGKGQIPIQAWRDAKAKGININDFKANYYLQPSIS